MNRSVGGWLVHDREYIGLAKDQKLFGIDGDFGAAVLSVENLVTDLELHRDANVLLVAAGADGDDLALLRLFLGGVGDEESTAHLLGVLERLDDDAIGEGCDLGVGLGFCGHSSCPSKEWLGGGSACLLALISGEC